jgi:hypothetical protein
MPFKSNALSDKDIIYILKSQGIKFNGIFMKNELPSKLKQGFYVINLQSSNIGDGTHWTALYYNYKHSFYFDAFGFVPPVELEQKINRYTYNHKQIQNLKSTACGYYCIAFIIFMYKRKKLELELGFKLFVDAFSTDTKKNDELLYNYLYN